MSQDRDDLTGSNVRPLHGADSQDSPPKQREEPTLSGFDTDDEYEEPDRDTDYASSYHDESLEEDDTLGYSSDSDSYFRSEEDTVVYLDSAAEDSPSQERSIDWEEEDSPVHATDRRDQDLDELDGEEDDTWYEDEPFYEESHTNQGLPLGLIAVAVVALLLLGAGGYGVIQQRAETQAEIRELRAALATAASADDVSASQEALQLAQERNASLTSNLDELSAENRRLADMVTGLEAQLVAEQKATQAARADAAQAKAESAKVAAPAQGSVSSNAWFVNFGSYGQRDMANSWAARLKPEAGEVVVTTGSKDGSTFYRVRVVNLPNRNSAEQVAGQLQNDFGVPKLWVGKQ
ncbi:MAG: SPOR domain-containing protein [Pseudomonadota bacterium]